ncbi:MAG: hypothetical protein AMS25_10650 [Gemmatimonas sp. SM23_52]|nr:MAG: hypothetical protein AMS25_10650 [Gemmatimonas sp. SM23_52]
MVATIMLACAGGPPAEEAAGEAQPEEAWTTDVLPPPGYGTLRQDDFTVPLQSGETQVKVTPLEEAVIRLAAPDTYQRLHGLVGSRIDQIRELGLGAGLRAEPSVFLVSFFTYARQAEFAPTELSLLSQGMLYRPIGIVPLTPGWGRQQLRQQESQSALYLFDPAIDLDLTFQAEYAGERSLSWAGIIRVLQAERGRVLSREKP